MTLEKMRAGYNAARKHAEKFTPPSIELPFKVTTKDELLSLFETFKKGMRIEPISRVEGYKIALTESSWSDSPESNLATLQAEQHFVTEFSIELIDGNNEAWRSLEPIHHKKAVKRASELWNRDRDALIALTNGLVTENTTYSSTVLHLATLNAKSQPAIEAEKKKILKSKPKIEPNQLDIEALNNVLGKPYISKKTNNLRSVMAYHHGKRISDRSTRINEVEKRSLAIHDEAERSTWRIGRTGRDFFDMGMFRIIKVNLETDKDDVVYPAGLLIQDPKLSSVERSKRPVGIGILPWFVNKVDYSSGDVYINISLRDEPGALNYSTIVAGEQASGDKILNGDILNQQGGDVIALCVQESLAVNCENLPELSQAIPPVFDPVLSQRDSNRIGGGYNAYAAIKVEPNSSLLEKYKPNIWISEHDLEAANAETTEKEPIVNELLLAAKGQLDQRLRNQAETREQKLKEILVDIAKNPETAFGWLIGSIVNALESSLTNSPTSLTS